MRALMLVLLWAMHAPGACASDRCPPTHMNAEWSVTCLEGEDDRRRVKAEFLDRIQVNVYGMATVTIDDSPGLLREVIAVDRHGNVVVPNIRHTGDFDYPSAYRGLGRFSVIKTDASGRRVEKCGYFQSPQYRVLVSPDFDQCDAFNEEGAFACKGCVSYCSDSECHVREFIGGRGYELDTNGRIKREFIVPTLDTFCRRPNLVRLTKISETAMSIHCDGPSDNPFVL